MQIQKKDGKLKLAQEYREKEKRYGWQSEKSISGIGNNDKKLNSSGSGVKSTMSVALIGKTVQIIRKAKEEMQNMTQGSGNRQRDSSFFLLLVGIVFVFLFCITPVFLLFATIEDSFSQTEALGIIEVAEQEEEVWEYNIGGKKYKQWYGIDGNWCAMFVSYCANECGYIEAGIMPKSASVANMAAWYKQRQQFVYKTDSFGMYYEPKAGDIIFFQNGMSHVGIVVAYDSETKKVTVIEGNTGSSSTQPYHAGSRVKRKIYPITYNKITGYGQPDYSNVALENKEDVL